MTKVCFLIKLLLHLSKKIMRINIISTKNGVGLEKDANLLQKVIEADTHFIDWKQPKKQHADINIHLEHIRKELIPLAKKNYLIPNPEWFDRRAFEPHLKRIDKVLCKTHHAVEIFSKLHSNVEYIGFTSVDMLDETIKKRKLFLHLAGKSNTKNSEAVRDVWKSNQNLLPIFFHKLNNYNGYDLHQGNWLFNSQRINDIKELLNTAFCHICPSKAEGFGHYINEALSCGAIVITTDAAPMNELVNPEYGFLVKCRKGGTMHLADLYEVEHADLLAKIKEVEQLPLDLLNEMSKAAREVFLKRHQDFVKRINECINI